MELKIKGGITQDAIKKVVSYIMTKPMDEALPIVLELVDIVQSKDESTTKDSQVPGEPVPPIPQSV